jgi:hypothetical protein
VLVFTSTLPHAGLGLPQQMKYGPENPWSSVEIAPRRYSMAPNNLPDVCRHSDYIDSMVIRLPRTQLFGYVLPVRLQHLHIDLRGVTVYDDLHPMVNIHPRITQPLNLRLRSLATDIDTVGGFERFSFSMLPALVRQGALPALTIRAQFPCVLDESICTAIAFIFGVVFEDRKTTGSCPSFTLIIEAKSLPEMLLQAMPLLSMELPKSLQYEMIFTATSVPGQPKAIYTRKRNPMTGAMVQTQQLAGGLISEFIDEAAPPE